MNIGDKVTIYDGRACFGRTIYVGVSTIETVGPKWTKTADGRKWNKLGSEVDACGSRVQTSADKIRPYEDGDEARVAREKLLEKARRLLRGEMWEVERDFNLLSDDDLRALAEISKRLAAARKTQNTTEQNDGASDD